jgi:four helix bundle protein
MPNSTFHDLRVWQEAMNLTEEIYRATTQFPKHELYGLSSQMRRAAVSVPSNIAEGKGHRTDPDFVRFLFHARGSLLELETQILIARRLQYLPEERTGELCRHAAGIGWAKCSHQPISGKRCLTTND